MYSYTVTVKWLIYRRVILVQPCGDFDPSVALAAIDQVKHLVNEGLRPIHLVMNTTAVRTPLRDPKVLGSSLNSLRHHPKRGCMVIVYSHPLSRIGAELLAKFLGLRFRVAESCPHALDLLRKLDPTLAGCEVERTV